MNVGVLGSGDVAKSLTRGFVDVGYSVTMGSRDPGKLQSFLNEFGGKVKAGSYWDAALNGEIIAMAVKGDSIKETIDMAGLQNLNGKIIIDVTNPLKVEPGKPVMLSLGFNTSNSEIIQDTLPRARVVKTLNIVANHLFVNPVFVDGDPDMFLCGNDEEAKKKVIEILQDFGWKHITDLGGVEEARLMEPLCILWVHYGMKNNTFNHAFKVLRK